MKKIAFALATVALLAGGMVAVAPSPSHAQDYEYPPQPADVYAQPWVGPDTPWVYYNGDWFLNGILYYNFGPEYGWAPYYAYPPVYMVRPQTWYAPRWFSWYQGHPIYGQNFLGHYSYWRGHREGQHYGRSFYEKHNPGHGGGWQKGFHGTPPGAHPKGVRPGAPGAVPPAGKHNPQPRLQHPQPQQRHQQNMMHGPQSQPAHPQMQHQMHPQMQQHPQQQMQHGAKPQHPQGEKKQHNP
ncbi:MAG: hypothetical protein P4L55_10615 [Syntrophobacteraceae bacterium]|nr:hypothetical protein [Syntrophobacteraceae bacterium]